MRRPLEQTRQPRWAHTLACVPQSSRGPRHRDPGAARASTEASPGQFDILVSAVQPRSVYLAIEEGLPWIIKSRDGGATWGPAAEGLLILTVYGDDDHVCEAIYAGAHGYLRATHRRRLDVPEIARKVVTMFQKFAPPRSEDNRLSARELEVLKLLAEGHSYKTTADRLDTIRFHVRNIYEKLHVHSRSEAVVKALKSGMLA